jgi:hypothetical protein
MADLHGVAGVCAAAKPTEVGTPIRPLFFQDEALIIQAEALLREANSLLTEANSLLREANSLLREANSLLREANSHLRKANSSAETFVNERLDLHQRKRSLTLRNEMRWPFLSSMFGSRHNSCLALWVP